MVTAEPISISDECRRLAIQGEPIIDNEQKLVIISLQNYEELAKLKGNAEYLEELDRRREQFEHGKTISFTLEELIAMESEDWKPTKKIIDFMKETENE